MSRSSAEAEEVQRRSASSPSSAGDKINDVGGTIDTKEVDAEAEDWSGSAPSGTAKWPKLGHFLAKYHGLGQIGTIPLELTGPALADRAPQRVVLVPVHAVFPATPVHQRRTMRATAQRAPALVAQIPMGTQS